MFEFTAGKDCALARAGYQSVVAAHALAEAVGFIALVCVAAETGVVMLIHLDHAWEMIRAAQSPRWPISTWRS